MFPPYLFDFFAGLSTKPYFALECELFSLAMTIYHVVMDMPHVNDRVVSTREFQFEEFIAPYRPMKNAPAPEIEAKRNEFLKAYQEKILNPLYADLEQRMLELGDTEGSVVKFVKAITTFTKYTPQQKEACFYHFATQERIAGIPEPTIDAWAQVFCSSM